MPIINFKFGLYGVGNELTLKGYWQGPQEWTGGLPYPEKFPKFCVAKIVVRLICDRTAGRRGWYNTCVWQMWQGYYTGVSLRFWTVGQLVLTPRQRIGWGMLPWKILKFYSCRDVFSYILKLQTLSFNSKKDNLSRHFKHDLTPISTTQIGSFLIFHNLIDILSHQTRTILNLTVNT